MHEDNSFQNFGEKIRSLRENSGHTLKQVAQELNVDLSLLAKIERNERGPTKILIRKISELFGVNPLELESEYLSDQIANKIYKEKADLSILKVAEAKVNYLKKLQNGK